MTTRNEIRRRKALAVRTSRPNEHVFITNLSFVIRRGCCCYLKLDGIPPVLLDDRQIRMHTAHCAKTRPCWTPEPTSIRPSGRLAFAYESCVVPTLSEQSLTPLLSTSRPCAFYQRYCWPILARPHPFSAVRTSRRRLAAPPSSSQKVKPV